jgi:hypothetical protein
MPEPVAATTGEQWMRQTERRIGLLERRPAQVGNRFTNDGVMWSRTMPEPTPYIEPTLAGYVNYAGGYHNAGYIKTSAGIVVHTGLIASTTGGTAYSVPPGYRPDGKYIAGVVNSTSIGAVVISTAGAVTPTAASWTSLASTMYPAAGVADWTPITTFVNGFADYHAVDTSYPVASYWADQYGRVYFQGLIYRPSGVIPATDTIAFTLPAALATESQIHLADFCSGGMASYHIAGTAFVVKSGSQGVAFMCLQKCTFVAGAIRPSSSFQMLRMTLTDWANYGGGFPPAAAVVFPDGIVMMSGLVNSGTIGPTGQVCFTPEGISPDNSLGPAACGMDVYLCNASQSVGRYDITRTQALYSSPSSAVCPISGTAGWRSLNGVNYLIGS